MDPKTTPQHLSTRLHALDSWRGIFAIVVAIGHCFVEFGEPEKVPGSFVLAVDFFFALSGFVIGGSLLNAKDKNAWVGSFVLARFFRIFPLYLLLLTLYALVFLPAFRGVNLIGNSIQEAVGFALLLQDTGLVETRAWELGRTSIGVAWTLSVEVWGGILFFTACALLSKNRVALALFLSVSVAVGLGLIVNQSPRYFNVHYHPLGFTTWGMVRGAVGFAAGFIAFLVWSRLGKIKRPTVAEVAVVAALLACYASVNYPKENDYLAPTIAGVLLVIFAQQQGRISRLLLTKPMLALGSWSFGIYLWHPLWIEIIRALDLPIGHFNYLIVLALTVAASAASFRWVERPMIYFGKSLRIYGPATKAT